LQGLQYLIRGINKENKLWDKLKTRIKEHINNIKLEPSRHSVISEHNLNYKYSFDWENVNILDLENNYKRLISEIYTLRNK